LTNSSNGTEPGFTVVAVGCADGHLDDLFAAIRSAANERGGQMYPVRSPGGVFAMAFDHWVARLLTESFILEADSLGWPILFVFLRHDDCGSEHWAIESCRKGEVWAEHEIKPTDELWLWALNRAIAYVMSSECGSDLRALVVRTSHKPVAVHENVLRAMDEMAPK